MAYKLYDFTQDPKLDEQIRLICDVLYNHREIYTGQIGGAAETSLSAFFKTREWHSAIFKGGAGGTSSSVNITGDYAHCTSTITTLAFANTTWDTPNMYGTLQTNSTVLDAIGKLDVRPLWAAGAGFCEPVHSPYSLFGIKTAAAIANTLMYIGVCQGGTGTVTTANKDLPAAYASNFNFVGVRYDPAGGGTWDVIHRQGLGAATITSTTVTVNASTAYMIEVYTADAGVSWIVKINGTIVKTITTNIPLVSSTLSPGLIERVMLVNTSAGANRQIRVARIYGENGGDLTLSA
jgi:hypothetical protein